MTGNMNIDPVHLAVRSTAEGAQKVLNELEMELAGAKARRAKILADIGKTRTAAEKGDKRQLFTLGLLNKQDAEVGRLVLSIERQIAEAKKRLAMAANQAATAAAKRASVGEAALARDKLFETVCPDGRKVRHRHHSIEALRRELQPGYIAVGQVFGAKEDDTGGFVADPKSDMMQAMLDAYGDTLLAWLAERGLRGDGKAA
jgi:hypothetical protein